MSKADIGQRGNTGVLFRNGTMDFTAGWLLGYAQQGGISPGALLHAYSRITDGNPVSWSVSFARSAHAARRRAIDAEAAGRMAEASLEWLATYNAHRAAVSMLAPEDERARVMSRAMGEDFRAYLRTSHTPLEPWEIPFGDALLPAYRTSDAKQTDRIVLIVGGGDTYVEDLWFFGAKALLEAGWPVVMADLPGQGTTPYQGLHFGPDTLDALAGVFEAVRARGFAGDVALLGWSGGGIFVTKYASIARPCDRLRAVVASAPVYDAEALFRSAMPKVLHRGPDSPLVRLALGVAARNKVIRASLAKYDWQFGPGGIASVLDTLARVGRTDIDTIDVPMLALVGLAEDSESLCQATTVIEGLRDRHPASLLVTFDAESGAASHCQIGNLPLAMARTIHWLDMVFDQPSPR